jgi:hypothetical protein
MPLIINNISFEKINGPTVLTLSIPKRGYENKPIILLIGERHSEIEKGCKNTHFNNIKDLLNQINILAKNNEIHFYTEAFLKKSLLNYIQNNDCNSIVNMMNEQIAELTCVGCAQVITGDLLPCYYKDFKNKCENEFNSLCKYPNIKWQYSDLRHGMLSNQAENIDKLIPIITGIVKLLYNYFEERDINMLIKKFIKKEITKPNIRQLFRLQELGTKLTDEELILLQNFSQDIEPIVREKYKTEITTSLEKIIDPNQFLNSLENILRKQKMNINDFKNMLNTYLLLLTGNYNEFIEFLFQSYTIRKQLEKINILDINEFKNKITSHINNVITNRYFIEEDQLNISKNKLTNFIEKLIYFLNINDIQAFQNLNNDEIILDINKLMNNNNFITEFFIKPLSIILDIYFILRIQKVTSNAKLIGSFIGFNHVLMITKYFNEISNEYDSFYFFPNNLQEEQCVDLNISYNINKELINQSYTLNLNEIIQQVGGKMKKRKIINKSKKKYKKTNKLKSKKNKTKYKLNK